MADSFHKIYLHIVFAVKFREAMIKPEWEDDLYKYTTGIIQNRGHKLLAINGMPDHIHIFIGFLPRDSVSDLVREVKKSTTQFIRDQNYLPRSFQWQNGYAVFSNSRSHVHRVCTYIQNQKTHHANKRFEDEYMHMLKEQRIDLDRKQVFEFIRE